tara:strand:+ start:7326 stop:8063 length:738 start_codon:yes stop_codon:yes gene_type:complete
MLSKNNSNIIVTGVGSGLGKYIHEESPGSLGLRRDNLTSIIQSATSRNIDTVIHCACNKSKDNYYDLYNDNLKLVETLCSMPHKNFVFISSIDVYSKEENVYSMMKRVAESIVKERSNNFLTLRVSALLGKYMKKNNICRVIFDKDPTLSLTNDSTYSLLSYEHIYQIISKSIEKNINGTYDVVAKSPISMGQIVKRCNKEKNTTFGGYKYLTKNIVGGIIERKLGMKQFDSYHALEKFIDETTE